MEKREGGAATHCDLILLQCTKLSSNTSQSVSNFKHDANKKKINCFVRVQSPVGAI